MKQITQMEFAELNRITYDIRGAAFGINRSLGAGLYESIYEKALGIELKRKGYSVKHQVRYDASFGNWDLGKAFRADIVVNNLVIIEIKSVKMLIQVHRQQLMSYLKVSGLPLGLLINFNTNTLQGNIHRLINAEVKK